MDSEERFQDVYNQVVFYIAPMALSIAFCLCCVVRIAMTSCVKVEANSRYHRSGGRCYRRRGLDASRTSARTTNTGISNRGLDTLRDYLRCSYGEIFLRTPPPSYDDSQKVKEYSITTVDETLAAPAEAPLSPLSAIGGILTPPPSYPPSRQVSVPVAGSSDRDCIPTNTDSIVLQIEELKEDNLGQTQSLSQRYGQERLHFTGNPLG